MVFNTGAALLDAIVLAVVSKEEEGTESAEDATGATTGLRMREERSWTIIAENGMTILRKYQSYFPRREFEDEQR